VTFSSPSAREERVLLLSMPFGALERPALSLGLLQAHCDRLGVACDTRYLTFDFARLVGLGDYLWLTSDDVPYTAFAGEWLFATALYGARPHTDAAYIDEVLRRTWRQDDAALARLIRIRGHVEPFLEHCLNTVPWGDYTLAGFTSVFHQNLASLALAARVKRKYPELTLCFGGANWEEVMGVTLQAQFPFVDLAFSGEADESFPAVLKARSEGRGVQGIRGVTASATNGLAQTSDAGRVPTMDGVPTPNFTAFFEQFRASSAAGAIAPTLLMETSRGCWWGERAHCTFCGLNGATMAFRSKSPERVLQEVGALHTKHGVRTFNIVDDILDMNYFHSVLPALAQAKLGLDFFWEIKSNLTYQQIRQLRDAGVTSVQPGIESLSDHVLKLMRKGVTAFRNIELLKWCKEYGIKPFWNLLYGFPGETSEDYLSMQTLLPAIWHLDPPTGYGPIRIDRFSPYHNEPTAFGMTNLRPMAPFTYLYPFSSKPLADIAYYFEFDYADGREDDEYAKHVVEMTRAWMADGARGMVNLTVLHLGQVEVLDTRGSAAAAPRRACLNGWKAAVYLACDRAQTLSSLLKLPQVEDDRVEEGAVQAFLSRCIANRLMIGNGKSWLNVAVHSPAREEAEDKLADAQKVSCHVMIPTAADNHQPSNSEFKTLRQATSGPLLT
jgi:ribosomal peptide maturation radical SAM protein 1